jgi:hypothetical protein
VVAAVPVAADGALDTASEPDFAVAAAPFERPVEEAPVDVEAGAEVEVDAEVEAEPEAAALERPAAPERLVLLAAVWPPAA